MPETNRGAGRPLAYWSQLAVGQRFRQGQRCASMAGMNTHDAPDSAAPAGGGCRLFALIFAAVLAAMLIAAIAIRFWLFPAALTPVELQTSEKLSLNQKLRSVGYQEQAFTLEGSGAEALEPEPYSEVGAKREIRFSERELNGLLAKNTDLARKLAIDLADDLASARLVLPVDPDFPILGGQTLRMSAGVEARFESGHPVLVLKGISVWGVPLPNAWLGNLKNVDLIAQFGDQNGFWQAFAEGVEELSVREGELFVRLKP